MSDSLASGGRHPEWLRMRQASELLGVSASTLRRWADSGKVASLRTPGGQRRFSRDDLAALLPPARAGGSSAARSSRENRLWPPGVRSDATFPESAQRRSVLALTPSSSEACRIRSHSGCRPPDARESLILRSIGLCARKLHHLCHRLLRGLGSGGAEEAGPRREAP